MRHSGRKRADFSLYSRNGVYYARQWDRETGRYTTGKSTGKRNKRDAILEAQRMLESGQFVARSEDPPLFDFLRDYWKNPRKPISAAYQANNLDFVERAAKCSAVAKLRRSEITVGLLNRLSDYLGEHYTARVHNQILQAVCVPLKWAFRRAYIARDVTLGVERATDEPKERGTLTLDEVRALLEAPIPKRDRAIIGLGCLAGLRRGEIRGLLWSDVDLDTRTLHVRHNYVDGEGNKEPKTKSSGDVIMLDLLAEILSELKAESRFVDPDDFVIWKPARGEPLTGRSIDRAFLSALDKIGIDKDQRTERRITLHSTRHTFVSFARREMPDFVVATLSRHKTTRMLDNYSHSDSTDIDTARERMNKRISGEGR